MVKNNPASMKSRVLLVAKATLSAALIALLLRSIDAATLASQLRELSAASLAIATTLIALQAMLLGWRWHRIVALLGGHLSVSNAVWWVFVGLFFNNALPTSVGGDAVRIWQLRKSGEPLALSIGSVAIERGTGLVLLALLISACTPAVWTMIGPQSLRLGLAALGPALLAGLIGAAFVDKAIGAWLPAASRQALAWLGDGLRSLAARPAALAEVGMLGVTASFTGLLSAYVLGHGLGIALSLPAYIVLAGGAVLLTVLPISLGGWGVREIGMVGLLGAVGIPAERALLLSLAWGALPLLVSLPAGVVWLLRGSVRPMPGAESVDAATPPPSSS